MDYALIENEKVINIIYLHPMNASDFPNAVPMNGLPVQIGDTYKDDKFYRDGVEINPSNDIESIFQNYRNALFEEVSNVKY